MFGPRDSAASLLLLFCSVLFMPLLGAQPESSTTLTVQSAVVLTFQTQNGVLYQLETTSNIGMAWTPLDEIALGNGQPRQVTVIAEEHKRGLFRLRQVVGTNGLVAYYPFNGNSLDASGLGNDAISIGANLSTNRFGQESSSYEFSEIGHVIRTASSVGFPEGTNDFTVSLWFHWNSVSSFTEQVLFANGLTNQFQLTVLPLGHHYAKLQFYLGGGPEADVTTKSINFWMSTWCLAQVVRSGGTVSIYFNNTRVGENKQLAGVYQFGTPLDFGFRTSYGNGQFFGHLDDIRIYNRALSATELQAISRIRDP